ncbi:hypothetical protein ColKHC_12078 [Colletotrichum higginsianum]|nr:hypothetical protein ColKHC_12078 [Colletotrichum higginsianum]
MQMRITSFRSRARTRSPNSGDFSQRRPTSSTNASAAPRSSSSTQFGSQASPPVSATASTSTPRSCTVSASGATTSCCRGREEAEAEAEASNLDSHGFPTLGRLIPVCQSGAHRRRLARELAVREQVDVALHQDAPGCGPVHFLAAEAVVREALELVDVVGEVHHGEDAVARHLEESHHQRRAPLGLDRRVVVVHLVEEDEEPPQVGVPDRRAAAEHVDLGADGELLDDPEPRPVLPLAEGAERVRHPPKEGHVGVGPDDVGVPLLPDQGAHGADVGEEEVAVVGREAHPDGDAGRGGVDVAHHLDLVALLSVVVLVDAQLVDPDVDALGPAEVPEGELAVEAAPLDGAVDDDGALGDGRAPAVRQGSERRSIAETVILELGGDEVAVGGGGFALGGSDIQKTKGIRGVVQSTVGDARCFTCWAHGGEGHREVM